MRVYTRRTGGGKRVHQPQSQSFAQRLAGSIGIGNHGNLNTTAPGSFQHVVKVDSYDSFDQPSLLALTACSEEDESLKSKSNRANTVPHVIPYENTEYTPPSTLGRESWVGIGLDGDEFVISPIITKIPIQDSHIRAVDDKTSETRRRSNVVGTENVVSTFFCFIISIFHLLICAGAGKK